MEKRTLFKNFGFYGLFFAQLLSHFADAISMFLLGTFLVTISESVGKSIAAAFLAFLIPQLIFAPLAGVLCEKFSKKLILALSCLFRFLALLAVAVCLEKLDHAGVFACAAVIGTFASFFYPAKMSAVPDIVKSGQLKYSNAFLSTTAMTALLLGTLGANCLWMCGKQAAFGIVCAMYFIAGLLVLVVNVSKKNNIQQGIIDYLKTHKKALFIVLSVLFLQFNTAVVLNIFNAMMTDFYGLGVLDLTVLRTFLGLGLIFGALLVLLLSKFVKAKKLLTGSAIFLAILCIGTLLCTNAIISCIWVFLTGLVSAIVITLLDTCAQKILPSGLRGGLFGITAALNALVFIAGTLIVANLVGFVNPLETFKSAGVFAFILMIVFFIVLHSIRAKKH